MLSGDADPHVILITGYLMVAVAMFVSIHDEV